MEASTIAPVPRPVWVDMSIGEVWRARAHRMPDATALIFEQRHWHYEELYQASARAACALRRLGLQAGQRVILMMDNGPGFLAAFLGCQLLGLLPVPASPKSSGARIAYLLADSGARLLLIEPGIGARARALHQAQPYHERMLELALDTAEDVNELEAAPVDPQACAFIQYTSGSTGHSKGVMISHLACLENIRAFCASMALTRQDVLSSLLPLYHDMGLMCFGLAPLLLGHPLVLYPQESISLYRWLAGVAKHRVSITGAPDSLLQIANRVVEKPSDYSLQNLRMLICGSEPVRRDSVENFGRRFGVAHAIKPAYGMAELTLCATLTAAGAPLRIDDHGNVASGQAIDGVSVAIRADDGSRNCAPHVRGEIVVRSRSAMSGYWGRPDESATAFDADGFLATGDLGYLDADGYLFVIGRKKNMLVRAGQKYSPHDMEMAAAGIPEVRRAAVVQLPDASAAIVAALEVDRRLLQQPTLLAVLARTYRQAAFAQAGVAPDACWFLAGGTIPSTENGKFRHAALGAMIAAGVLRPGWADAELALEGEFDHA
ncbi:acyl-CoA synthetase (AMP-forming)/AMP-acid ligase II [Oxalobacteraceae bacterium GrIS 1.11]